MVRKYELHLRDFCKRFQPVMPRCVIGSAFHYFKRFYIHNSVMNYHPKEIMYVDHFSILQLYNSFSGLLVCSWLVKLKNLMYP